MNKQINSTFPMELSTDKLTWKCPPEILDFNTTKEIEPLDKIVGQPRAIDAIKLGVNLHATGYNIFVTGISGTGRTSTVKKVVEKWASTNDKEMPETYDFCYVNNFKEPDKPRLVRLLSGKGKFFANAMNEAIEFLKEHLPKLFESDEFQKGRQVIIDNLKKIEEKAINQFDNKIEKLGYVRGQVDNGKGQVQPDIFYKVEDKLYQLDSIDKLIEEGKIAEADKEKIVEKYNLFRNELYDIMRNSLKLARKLQKQIIENDKRSAEPIVLSAFIHILEEFNTKKIQIYINEVIDYIYAHLTIFVPNSKSNKENKAPAPFVLFKVNVILDNSITKQRPIIIETNPNYNNLFGSIEKKFDPRGYWESSFINIKAGSLLAADQGFLLVNAMDLFNEPGVWNALKKVLLYERLEIQPYDSYFQVSQSHLKPEKIHIKVKVIIIGGISLYNALYHQEKGFKKMFKVLSQFAGDVQRDDQILKDYVKFISHTCNSENLLHCDNTGVSAIIEWAVKHTGSQENISLRFSDVSDIIREAEFYANTNKHKLITNEDVEQVIKGRSYRNGLTDERITRSILDGTIMIATDGQRVGQINGLTVYSTGLFSFGKPARITASISAGNRGIVNVEREANMSGNIHNKGILIITGFINERFGKRFPLSLTASIAFEQSYGGIDGDSASAAEIYVLLSALTNKPINQHFAITGSMNQKGDIQPIGGVNEKVTGFYEICKKRGFDGHHGAIIPKQNIKDLMLGKEIIEDVEKGNFKIYAIERIEDGIPLLFGMPAGETNDCGKYPEDSLFALTVKKLEAFRKSGKSKNPIMETTKKKPKPKRNAPQYDIISNDTIESYDIGNSTMNIENTNIEEKIRNMIKNGEITE